MLLGLIILQQHFYYICSIRNMSMKLRVILDILEKFYSISDLFPRCIVRKARYMELADRLCRRSAAFLTRFAIFAGWQSPLQKYISLPLHTSVSGISKRHAHKVFIKCPVSKLRLRLQTVETGHYFLFAYAAKKCQETSPNFAGKDI